jgi:hypothetical protein
MSGTRTQSRARSASGAGSPATIAAISSVAIWRVGGQIRRPPVGERDVEVLPPAGIHPLRVGPRPHRHHGVPAVRSPADVPRGASVARRAPLADRSARSHQVEEPQRVGGELGVDIVGHAERVAALIADLDAHPLPTAASAEKSSTCTARPDEPSGRGRHACERPSASTSPLGATTRKARGSSRSVTSASPASARQGGSRAVSTGPAAARPAPEPTTSAANRRHPCGR